MLRNLTHLAFALAACATGPALAADPVVDAPAGAVRGAEDRGIRVFRGIAYAQPPVGERRWLDGGEFVGGVDLEGRPLSDPSTRPGTGEHFGAKEGDR